MSFIAYKIYKYIKLYISKIYLFLPFFQIFPINVKGSAGSLVTLTNKACGWIVIYTFNFMMQWSSSGRLTHQFPDHTNFCFLFVHIWSVCYRRDILHLRGHFRLNCTFHCEASTGDQRSDFRRNSSIHVPFSSITQIENYKVVSSPCPILSYITIK